MKHINNVNQEYKKNKEKEVCYQRSLEIWL